MEALFVLASHKLYNKESCHIALCALHGWISNYWRAFFCENHCDINLKNGVNDAVNQDLLAVMRY